MEKNRTILASSGENFLVRVLVKKLSDAGIPTEFVQWKISTLGAKLSDAGLLIIFLDDGEHLPEKLSKYLDDRLSEEGKHIVLIGDKGSLQAAAGVLPEFLIYHDFERPVNNEEFVDCVKSYFDKREEGEFKKRILVVDDDPNYLNLVRDWLRETYRVSMANSGLQAIKYLGNNKVDLILLDHEMPVMSGPQVLNLLRSDEETRDIPVMFLTGKNDRESVMKVVALKPEAYFLKTIEKQELLKNLDNYFRKADK